MVLAILTTGVLAFEYLFQFSELVFSPRSSLSAILLRRIFLLCHFTLHAGRLISVYQASWQVRNWLTIVRYT